MVLLDIVIIFSWLLPFLLKLILYVSRCYEDGDVYWGGPENCDNPGWLREEYQALQSQLSQLQEIEGWIRWLCHGMPSDPIHMKQTLETIVY